MRRVDARNLVDDARFNRFHLALLLWCTLICTLDGYDIVVAGIALPSIMKQMGVDATRAGFMFSSAIFGMACGAILFGTVADRIGRRWALAICVTVFSVLTALTSFTADPITFSVTRFLAGLGLGGAVPCMVALMTEYAPKHIRARMVTLMFTGFALGSALAAEVGKSLIAAYGWHAMFLAAGLPVILVPFIVKLLPESMPFLIKAGRIDRLKGIIAKVAPTYQPLPDDQIVLPAEDRADEAPIGHLFHEGRGFSTIMFWIATFMCLFMLYAISSWMLKLLISAGHDQQTALTLLVVSQMGIVVGTIGGGWLSDRLPFKLVLLVFFALAAVSITSIGFAPPVWLLYVLTAVMGAATVGTQFILYAYVGQFYPMAVRSTGVGWTAGMGRVGGIAGPIVIGTLIAMNPPIHFIFMAIAAPALVALVAIALIDHNLSASAHHGDVRGEVPDEAAVKAATMTA